MTYEHMMPQATAEAAWRHKHWQCKFLMRKKVPSPDSLGLRKRHFGFLVTSSVNITNSTGGLEVLSLTHFVLVQEVAANM